MVFKTDYRLMQIKSIAECSREHPAILKTFIKLPVVFKTMVLSLSERQFYTGFPICKCLEQFSLSYIMEGWVSAFFLRIQTYITAES